MGDFSIFAIRIKELRTSLNMTQKDFSAHVGCTAATLSAYENGSKRPSLEIIKGIAEKCSVSIDWLCGLSEKMKNNDEPETYADVIDLLVKAEKPMHFRVGGEKITVNDSVLQYFLKDWGPLLPLLHDEIIDNKLYKLWIDEKRKEYANIHLGNTDEIEEFLSIMTAIETANNTSKE